MFTLKFIVYMKVFLYQIDLILSLIDYDAQLLGYYMQALLQAFLLTNFDKPLRHLWKKF